MLTFDGFSGVISSILLVAHAILLGRRALEQVQHAGVVAVQPALALVVREHLVRVVVQEHEARLAVVVLDHRLPDRHRHLVGRRGAPRQVDDLNLAVGSLVEDPPGEVERQRHLAVGQGGDVARRRDLEVGRAGHLQAERRRSAEGVHERARVAPQEAARRRRPALGRAEQLDELGLRLGVVVAARGVEVDLRLDRDGVDRAVRRLGDAELEAQRRLGGEGLVRGAEDLERHLRARIAVESRGRVVHRGRWILRRRRFLWRFLCHTTPALWRT